MHLYSILAFSQEEIFLFILLDDIFVLNQLDLLIAECDVLREIVY